MSKGRVIVAMSGGVDSSVAALLMKRQGYDVIGVTMRLWTVQRDDLPSLSKRCCSVEDVEDARRVCQVIGVPHYVQNFEREFQAHVVDYFVREYDRGRTPHPCLACNDKIKFDFLLRRAIFLDADYIATGHYARVARQDGELKLLKGSDAAKDQSYVLFTLTQGELARLMLPVGEYSKEEIRLIAADAGLPVARQAGQSGDMLHTRRRLPLLRRRSCQAQARRDGRLPGQAPWQPPRNPVLHRRTAEGPGPEGQHGRAHVRDRDPSGG